MQLPRSRAFPPFPSPSLHFRTMSLHFFHFALNSPGGGGGGGGGMLSKNDQQTINRKRR